MPLGVDALAVLEAASFLALAGAVVLVGLDVECLGLGGDPLQAEASGVTGLLIVHVKRSGAGSVKRAAYYL